MGSSQEWSMVWTQVSIALTGSYQLPQLYEQQWSLLLLAKLNMPCLL